MNTTHLAQVIFNFAKLARRTIAAAAFATAGLATAIAKSKTLVQVHFAH